MPPATRPCHRLGGHQALAHWTQPAISTETVARTPPDHRRTGCHRPAGAAVQRATGVPRVDRSAGGYLVSSATRRSTSSSTVPVLGRLRLPASSASSLLVRLW